MVYVKFPGEVFHFEGKYLLTMLDPEVKIDSFFRERFRFQTNLSGGVFLLDFSMPMHTRS